jgi:hypothetical protein
LSISEKSIVSRSEDLLEASMEDSLALMSIEKGSYYGLNPVGKEIWENIDKPISVINLIDLLLTKFNIDKETCQKETIAFLGKLEIREIISISKP